MDKNEFPVIISPNLGCPHIIGADELDKGITLVIAGRYGETAAPLRDVFDGVLFLHPSYHSSGRNLPIPLIPASDPVEIRDWNHLSGFSNEDETRELINSELHYNVLGEGTRYWKLKVMPGPQVGGYISLLGAVTGGRRQPRLYDLVLKDKDNKCEKVNLHAVQLVESRNGPCNFIHLTDLHVAQRNDEILDEVTKEKNMRDGAVIEQSYINFNDKLREFIRIANGLAEKGELDFVVITGDLVDFALLGWEDTQNPDENNWKTFVNIITGMGVEDIKGNPGIKVAVYTSTGNHDWRVHPYDPAIGNVNETYGLRKDELEYYDYKSFDSKEFRAERLAKATDAMVNEEFEKLNVKAFKNLSLNDLHMKTTKFAYKYLSRTVNIIFALLGLAGGGFIYNYHQDLGSVWALTGAAGLLPGLVKMGIKYFLKKQINFILYNPILAEAASLHYYMKHINPYLDYAFSYGVHTFIVMDTGADVFTGELDNKAIKKIRKMSVEDNIFGGSPDSCGFDSDQCYCNWSQIVWLEKVLEAVYEKGTSDSSFVFLHSPPINPPHNKDLKELRESRKNNYITKKECNLTFGTINNYLSEFFYLCTGSRESRKSNEGEKGLQKVDIVFSGHAHRNIEFRIKRELSDNKAEIRIYSDVYSELLETNNTEKWWNDHRPIILQTAACGVSGRFDNNPPYYRKVAVDGGGIVTDFKVLNRP